MLFRSYFGMRWQVIAQAVDSASDCEGGMLRLAKSSHTTPESYIRAHRKAVEDAVNGFEGAGQRGLIVRPQLRFDAANPADSDKYTLDKLTEAIQPETESWYGHIYTVFHFDVSKPEQLTLWTKYARKFNAAEVIGPRN